MDICTTLSEIGFTSDEISLYKKHKSMVGNSFDSIKAEYLSRKIRIYEALQRSKDMFPQIHEYMVELLFVLECADEIFGNCIKAGLGYNGFILTMRDVRCKVNECLAEKKVFGIFVGWWYDRFIFLSRYAFGRLQFDIIDSYNDTTVKFDGNILEKGDFALDCHIPSMGRLLHEDCIDSYKQAYSYFKDRLKDGVLPILCYSWLLYPRYLKVFGENSNTCAFARDFHIFSSYTAESQRNTILSRVFSTDDTSISTDALPQNTSMQRGFVEYFKSNEYAYGYGKGIIFFDGEKVLSARQ